jgi:hypothetical protein
MILDPNTEKYINPKVRHLMDLVHIYKTAFKIIDDIVSHLTEEEIISIDELLDYDGTSIGEIKELLKKHGTIKAEMDRQFP